jgi:glycosyltransferase involved in cell wall biosynthesis
LNATAQTLTPEKTAEAKRIIFKTLPKAHVAILMGTCQGERFLAEQLDSLAAQTHTDWRLWVSDDGSSDGTLALLKSYQKKWGGQLAMQPGPCKGFARNFLSLLRWPDIQADYYAYCDQDDIWHADKLERALQWLRLQPSDRPALYCSRTRLIDEKGAPCGQSPLFTSKPSFRNALVQNLAGGNTMVFNAATRNLIYRAGTNLDVVSHDWWTYLLVAAAGGAIYYDARPAVDYRQRGKSKTGSHNGWKAQLERGQLILGGGLKTWNQRHVEILMTKQQVMTEGNKKTFRHFCKIRNGRLGQRLWGMCQAGLYRQTPWDSIILFVAIALNRI